MNLDLYLCVCVTVNSLTVVIFRKAGMTVPGLTLSVDRTQKGTKGSSDV